VLFRSEKFISDKNYDEALQECLRTNHNHLGLLLSHIVTSSSCVKQFQTNIAGIQTEGKIVDETSDENNERNPPVLSDVEDDAVDGNKKIRVKLLTNWTSSRFLRELWNKMSQGNYTWNNIQIVLDDDPDYFVVINAPPVNENPDPSKTIVFRMEPHMDKNVDRWKNWASPDPSKF